MDGYTGIQKLFDLFIQLGFRVLKYSDICALQRFVETLGGCHQVFQFLMNICHVIGM
ncbi:Uncharacterised protein [Chlamydia trachomatis]|nr:Uncharacterised protein [Chlamydia trachomatis]